MSSEGNTAIFTAGESRLLLCMLKHLKDGNINTDFDAVAEEMGYKDGGVVQTRWGQIRRSKITKDSAEKVTPIKKRSKKVVNEDDDNGDVGASSKKVKLSAKKPTGDKVNVDADGSPMKTNRVQKNKAVKKEVVTDETVDSDEQNSFVDANPFLNDNEYA